jgi:hypothetical protein
MMDMEQKETALPRLPRKAKAFLAALRDGGNVYRACVCAGVARGAMYRLREADPVFASAWQEALEEAADRLEEEARRRAVEGLARKWFNSKGEPLIDPETGEQYFEREYSDGLLMQLLKAARPRKYRDNVGIEQSAGAVLKIVEVIVDACDMQAQAKP